MGFRVLLLPAHIHTWNPRPQHTFFLVTLLATSIALVSLRVTWHPVIFMKRVQLVSSGMSASVGHSAVLEV